MLPSMITIKSKIREVIQRSNGFPNYTEREYLDVIRLVLNEILSNEELAYIRENKINLDQWVMDITRDLTKDLF